MTHLKWRDPIRGREKNLLSVCARSCAELLSICDLSCQDPFARYQQDDPSSVEQSLLHVREKRLLRRCVLIHWTATECMCACWTINHCACVLIFFCLYDPFTCILSVHEGDNLLVLPVGYLMLRMCEQHLVVKSVDMYYQSSVSHDQHAEGKLLSRYAKIYMFLPLFAATSCFWTLYLLDCSTWDQQDLRIAMLYVGFGSLYP